MVMHGLVQLESTGTTDARTGIIRSSARVTEVAVWVVSVPAVVVVAVWVTELWV